jgi:hypothetical protein
MPGNPLAAGTLEANPSLKLRRLWPKEFLDCTIHREPKKIFIITANGPNAW